MRNGNIDWQAEALCRRAMAGGMSRRGFLALLGTAGASAVLGACASPPTLVPSPAPSPKPTPGRLTYKPVPSQFFVPMGTNAEMRFEVMGDRSYVTPNSLFFVRSHSPASSPPVDVTTWKLSIQGDGVEKPFQVSYDELLKLPSKTVTRFVECAGNGRSFYDSLMKKPAEGGQWKLGGWGIAEWTGVPLSALLERAGIKKTAVDVMPGGADATRVERPMPVQKALEDDTIIAYLMNGDILPVDHGFPARAIVAGWVGSSNVKWVDRLTVSEKPIFVEKNTTSYVLIGPDYEAQPPAKGAPVTTQVMKSACCLPWEANLKPGSQKVTGYAWSPAGKISRVEVSVDGGRTFRDATLTGRNIERSGTKWEFGFEATPGITTITPRATDERGNTQHDVSQQKWNQLGYNFGAMAPHPVKVA